MFRFVKQIFVSVMTFFGCNISCVNSLNAVPKCISMNNQECKIRPEIVNIYSNEPSFCPYSIKLIKYSGSCNDMNDPYSKLCVQELVSGTNETRHMKWHETCKCKCRLVFVIINNLGIMINADVNAKN